jgi:hypothetical protein
LAKQQQTSPSQDVNKKIAERLEGYLKEKEKQQIKK